MLKLESKRSIGNVSSEFTKEKMQDWKGSTQHEGVQGD
jgi:hypothetical protein